ncbi:uncharacterized protein LOC126370996 [Pectinophora gossypiella]|uniref:uncharacterized protein LOC126370996 n=1 Tax=Pectinophora gossypiella TaxID=13191 RepID=UPI00214E8113|nr:uncharacterized protein LOC126370996 [Pectinophora gossypiella]XP_049872151.1 uncharacterized protein LOC126370996 [Pectinophora gossypiella]XP_049872152.1 uncharacterized protein LOC126370996 [Pectinophora gossypiella]
MEVMSSLLLCALVALLPQTLVSGKQSVRSSTTDIRFNNTIIIQQQKAKHKLLLNLNGQPLVVKVNELQNVFSDYSCSHCTECMERAIRAHKLAGYQKDRPDSMELHNDILKGRVIRERRSANDSSQDKGDKKNKTKRAKAHRSITVTKYNIAGEVHALKVKESNPTNDETKVGSCEVYKVSKSYACNSPDGEAILSAAKRKNNKKNKKDKDKQQFSTTTGAPRSPQSVPVFRKRQIEKFQIPENVMPSIEEFY